MIGGRGEERRRGRRERKRGREQEGKEREEEGKRGERGTTREGKEGDIRSRIHISLCCAD